MSNHIVWICICCLINVASSELDGTQQETNSNARAQRFLVSSSIKTERVTTNTVTSSLTVFLSCFTTNGNIPACSSTILSGRRRRRDVPIVEHPITRVQRSDGVFADLLDNIQASKTIKTESNMTTKFNNDNGSMQEVDIIGIPSCNTVENREISRFQRALITIINTLTTSVQATTTQTVIGGVTQTLRFSSENAGDCLPTGLLQTMSIAICS
ncbi:uncharacterized protein [Lepeophtheirus salmonis]|uniref:uncharacterized protein n=1 Tax=Lepeophtheirus salmonis TaxID=72036 RepID=UPI001AE472D2|nr:uncharacterized protein LOC121116715 [Lepeophtheirus salmonis]